MPRGQAPCLSLSNIHWCEIYIVRNSNFHSSFIFVHLGKNISFLKIDRIERNFSRFKHFFWGRFLFCLRSAEEQINQKAKFLDQTRRYTGGDIYLVQLKLYIYIYFIATGLFIDSYFIRKNYRLNQINIFYAPREYCIKFKINFQIFFSM